MSKQEIISSVVISCNFILLALYPFEVMPGVALIFALILFGLLQILKKRDDSKFSQLEKRIDSLKDQLDGVQLSRGMR